MSVFDKFLNAIKLNEDDVDEDDYFDEDDDIDDSRPSRRFLSRSDDDDADDRRNYGSSSANSYDAPRPIRKGRAVSKVSPFRPKWGNDDVERNNFSVCVIRPKTMEDALQIAHMLIQHCTIILNLEGLDLDISQRVFDFASGACCAVRGQLDKISNYIFVLTPHDVDISGEFQEILTGAFDADLDSEDDYR